MNLEFDEIRPETFAGEMCCHDSLFCIPDTGGVGQELHMFTIDMTEHIVLFLVLHVDALHGHGYHLGTRS